MSGSIGCAGTPWSCRSSFSSAYFKRRDGANAGKKKALTKAGRDTQLRDGLLHDFKPHKILAQQTGLTGKKLGKKPPFKKELEVEQERNHVDDYGELNIFQRVKEGRS
ncbi:uncharacterized protein VSU04_016457 [Chlamydotis macqueenii]